jgi:mxaK protein
VKRRHVHLLFGLSALAFALMAGYQAKRLEQAERVNEAIERANAGALDSNLPEALFARALLLSRGGPAQSEGHDQAVKIYKEIIQGGRAEWRQAALYNLGNLYMHDALRSSPDNAMSALPLIELAKQSYRDLLRENPANWDARYNLERALWLAPELAEGGVEDNGPAPWQRRLITLPPGFKIDLP